MDIPHTMKNIIMKYEELMEKHSDSRVKNWMLMSGVGPTLYIIIAYLCLVLLLVPAFMKNREPFKLTVLIRCYNVSQIVICGVLFYMIVTSGWIQGDYSMGCQAIDYTNNPKALRILRAVYYTYLLKIYELSETVLFALRKKFNQISLLHIYHHVSTLLIGYIGSKFIGGGMLAVPVMMNLLIHIFMYTYYYLSSFGIKWQNRLSSWKSKLTMAQMVQFALMIIHSITAFQPGCEVSTAFYFMFVPNIFLLFRMFLTFYKRSYKCKTL